MKMIKFIYRYHSAYTRTPTDQSVKIFLIYEAINAVSEIFRVRTRIKPAAGEDKKSGS